MVISKMNGFTKSLAFMVAVYLATTGVSQASVMLTDSSVFSTNDAGENWNGWIWNTQAPPADSANRWNLYYSSSLDPQNPTFLNSENNASTNIDIELTPGIHSFLIYGETVTTDLHPLQHFVLNLYFDGNQAAPDISGLNDCPDVCAVSHWNGLDLFGNSGLGGNLDAQEAGTLIFTSGGHTVELTKFTWVINENVDRVWPHWDDTVPYDSGSGNPDFVGEIELNVTAVPEPMTIVLMGLGIAGLWFAAGRPGNRHPLSSLAWMQALISPASARSTRHRP
jgi:hypothetical protein